MGVEKGYFTWKHSPDSLRKAKTTVAMCGSASGNPGIGKAEAACVLFHGKKFRFLSGSGKKFLNGKVWICWDCGATVSFYMNTGRFEAGASLIQEIDVLLARHSDKVPTSRRINFYYNLTIYHFMSGQWKKALNWLNQLLNLPKSEVREHLQDFARIIQLVIHLEPGNQDLLEYLFRSAYRHYQGKKRLRAFEKT